MNDFQKIELGLDILFERDGYLLKNCISERSITHKLGEYYQMLFPDWNVDCEYNKNLGKPKDFSIEPRNLLRQMALHLEKREEINILKSEDFHGLGKFMPEFTSQLKNPEIDYLEEQDIWFFVLKMMNGEKVKKTIFPDIIVHERGKNNNKIVFEVKKSDNRSKEAYLYDMVKLATLVSSPKYRYEKGIFINLPVGKDFNNFNNFMRITSFNPKVFKYFPMHRSI